MNKNTYLVLHDFTPVGEAALNYAMNLSTNLNNEIKLVHLVDDKSKLDDAEKKLKRIISETPSSDNTNLVPLVRVGNIFEDIHFPNSSGQKGEYKSILNESQK